MAHGSRYVRNLFSAFLWTHVVFADIRIPSPPPSIPISLPGRGALFVTRLANCVIESSSLVFFSSSLCYLLSLTLYVQRCMLIRYVRLSRRFLSFTSYLTANWQKRLRRKNISLNRYCLLWMPFFNLQIIISSLQLFVFARWDFILLIWKTGRIMNIFR